MSLLFFGVMESSIQKPPGLSTSSARTETDNSGQIPFQGSDVLTVEEIFDRCDLFRILFILHIFTIFLLLIVDER